MVDMGEFWRGYDFFLLCLQTSFWVDQRIFTKVEALESCWFFFSDWHLPKVTLPSNRVFSRFFLEIDSKEWRLYRFFRVYSNLISKEAAIITITVCPLGPLSMFWDMCKTSWLVFWMTSFRVWMTQPLSPQCSTLRIRGFNKSLFESLFSGTCGWGASETSMVKRVKEACADLNNVGDLSIRQLWSKLFYYTSFSRQPKPLKPLSPQTPQTMHFCGFCHTLSFILQLEKKARLQEDQLDPPAEVWRSGRGWITSCLKEKMRAECFKSIDTHVYIDNIYIYIYKHDNYNVYMYRC